MQSDNTIEKLESLVLQGCELVKDIRGDLTFGLSVGNLYHYDLFDLLELQFQRMNAVILLTKNQMYGEAFVLIRSILEMLLLFWLMVDGKFYRWTTKYTVPPKSNLTAEQRRDQVVDEWQRKKEQGDPNYQHILHLQKLKQTNAFQVVYHQEGLYDSRDEKKEQFIPFYYFLLTEHYIPSLILEELNSISAADPHPETSKELISTQKQLYYYYIRFDAILENLLLNKLITELQQEYLKIHYSFLSGYVHPSKQSMIQFDKGLSKFYTPQMPEEIAIEQILLYLCRIQHKFLDIIVKKFKKENPSALTRKYEQLMINLNIRSTHFWFFDNNPTSYDKYISDSKKHLYKAIQKKEPDNIVLYYEDPLERLYRLKNLR